MDSVLILRIFTNRMVCEVLVNALLKGVYLILKPKKN